MNYSQQIKTSAKKLSRDMRKLPTEAEKLLWEGLRNRKLDDKKYLRQHVIFYDSNDRNSFFIADFYCAEEKLIIEVDGKVHQNKQEEDEIRTAILQGLGYKVLRIITEMILTNINEALNIIKLNTTTT